MTVGISLIFLGGALAYTVARVERLEKRIKQLEPVSYSATAIGLGRTRNT